MKPKFYLNRFILAVFGSQLLIYLCWSFIELSFTTPFIETFNTTDSRGVYIAFLVIVLFCGAPFYLPFEEED